MNSIWDEREAQKNEGDLAQLDYAIRLLSREPSLLLHPDGCGSIKTRRTNVLGAEEEILSIAESRDDGIAITTLRRQPLADLIQLPELGDGQLANEIACQRIDASAPMPPIGALAHAIIPAPCVFFTQPDALVAIACSPGGAGALRAACGETLRVCAYARSGFALARACAAELQSATGATAAAIFIPNQGLLAFGSTARECYERVVDFVTRAELYQQAHQAGSIELPVIETTDKPLRAQQAQQAQLRAQLRKTVSDAAGHPMILTSDQSEAGLAFSRRADLAADFAAMAGQGLAPRIILDPELGLCAAGRTAGETVRAAELGRHTLAIILRATALGGYQAQAAAQATVQATAEAEDAEQALTSQAFSQDKSELFAGEVALVTGAASGIGKGCVEALLSRGAAVVGLDISPRIANLFDTPSYLGLVCDLTDEQAVVQAFETTARKFGGLDMLVLNAGIFPPGCRIDSLSLIEWQRVMRINLDSNLIVMREAYPLLKLAPRYGRVVVNGSRNVPAPGPGAGAYSASKAAVTQLARVAALEWAKDRIRINMVHPHAVFDTGIWTEEVLKARSASYGMTVEQYKTNNLLHVELTSRDVGEMVAEMCGPLFAKTTGAQVPMDGGSDRVL